MRRYWLMKSEPDVYSIDDLARDGREPWTGVRNYQARNFMRDGMRVGDLALFYHSNAKPPGVVGLMRVDSEAEPDPSALEVGGEYHDARATPEEPVWFLRWMAYVETFPRGVPLEELRADPELEGLWVARRGQRLSIQPVEEPHFRRILALAGARFPWEPA